MTIALGYDKAQDASQTVPTAENLQQIADALRRTGIEPDIIWAIDAQGNQPSVQNTFRKGVDYN
jgi:hypothetical protein